MQKTLKTKKQKLHAFSYYGGKFFLIAAIVAMMPVHTAYVEVFGGSASILLDKKPSKVEVYNDINKEIVNFFYVLRNYPNELIKRLNSTPYSRDEFEICLKDIKSERAKIERARMFFVKQQQSFAGRGNSWSFGVTCNHAGAYTNKVNKLELLSQRLKSVQIENRSFEFLITRYCKNENVLAYLDPPYMQETRASFNDYAYEMTDKDHEEMLKLVLRSKAKFMISGYDNELYNRMLKKWNRREFDAVCHSAHKAGQTNQTKPHRTEVIWYNYKLTTTA